MVEYHVYGDMYLNSYNLLKICIMFILFLLGDVLLVHLNTDILLEAEILHKGKGSLSILQQGCW